MREANKNRLACVQHLEDRISQMGLPLVAGEFHKLVAHIHIFDETSSQVELDNKQNRIDALRFLGDNIVFLADHQAAITQKKTEAWIDEMIGQMVAICDEMEAYLQRKN